MKLTDVKGVDKTKAERLRAHNIECAEELAQATLKEVTKIDGISDQTVINAQELVSAKTRSDYFDELLPDGEISWKCSHCSWEQWGISAVEMKGHNRKCNQQ